MCTKKDQVNAVKSGDLNVTVNKQQTRSGGPNLCNDSHSVDFRIHTNIEVVSNKKLKICLIINLLFTIVCLSGSFIFTYKIYTELLAMQHEMLSLNVRLSALSESCERIEIKADALRSENETNRDDTDIIDDIREKEPPDEEFLADGTLAAHFKGSLPEIHVRDQSVIGPWYADSAVSRQYKFPKFHLTEGKCSIEVTESALYLIYAQVYYITSSALNSYTIYVKSEGASENRVIAKCNAIGPNNSHVSEITCFTSSVYSLKTNDRIFIQQTEKNRTIILRDGHSFFGLVRLNNARRSA